MAERHFFVVKSDLGAKKPPKTVLALADALDYVCDNCPNQTECDHISCPVSVIRARIDETTH